VAQGIALDGATCSPVQGVFAQGILAHDVTSAYFRHWGNFSVCFVGKRY